MKIVLVCLVSLLVACGKKDKKNSSAAFSSQYGVSSCAKSLVIIPYQGNPTINAKNVNYQIGQGSSQAAIQVIYAMYNGQIGVQPYTQTPTERHYRANVCGMLSSYGGTGYSAGGYQQPVNSNMLDVQSIQPY